MMDSYLNHSHFITCRIVSKVINFFVSLTLLRSKSYQVRIRLQSLGGLKFKPHPSKSWRAGSLKNKKKTSFIALYIHLLSLGLLFPYAAERLNCLLRRAAA